MQTLDAASWPFIHQPPITLAGALALIEYIERFNSGALVHHPEPKRGLDAWKSNIMHWPNTGEDDDADEADSYNRFGFYLMAAVVRSIAGKAVRS